MRLLVICPTVNRPEQLFRMFESFKRNTDNAEIFFVLEDNDKLEANLEIVGDYPHIITGKIGTIEAVNRAYTLNQGYDAYMFVGDDTTFNTESWDTKMLDALSNHIKVKGHRYGAVFANDLIHSGALAVHPILTKELCKSIGGYFPPNYMKHLYSDSAVHYIASGVESLIYLDSVIIEHHHYMNKKAEVDECYIRGNNENRDMIDKEIYRIWLEEKGRKTVEKLYKEIKK